MQRLGGLGPSAAQALFEHLARDLRDEAFLGIDLEVGMDARFDRMRGDQTLAKGVNRADAQVVVETLGATYFAAGLAQELQEMLAQVQSTLLLKCAEGTDAGTWSKGQQLLIALACFNRPEPG